jgi:hypothetical protein
MTKVVAPKGGWEQRPKTKPLLPLLPEPVEELKKNQMVTLELYSDPANKATSPKYKFTMQLIHGTEDVRTLIQWITNILTVLQGMDITTAVNTRQMVEQLTRSTARSIFKQAWEKNGNEAKALAIANAIAAGDGPAEAAARAAALETFMTADLILMSLRAVITGCTPQKVLQRVKRYMRREMRKPPEMKIRQYLVHLVRMNDEEVPSLPPFGPNQGLSLDELVDIILYAVPKSWIKEMDRQGFDPMVKTPMEVVNFLEQIETSEDFDSDKQKQVVPNNNKNKGKPQKQGSNNNNANGNGGKYCMLHGKGNHSTEECRNMQAQAKRMKTNGGESKSTTGGGSKNKTWSRKSENNKSVTKKEINSLVKKAAKKAAQKEINALNKKRKSDDSDSEEEMNNIEEGIVDIDLNDFDANDLERVLDDDEITV